MQKKDRKLVPELRFPNYSELWKEYRIAEILDRVSKVVDVQGETMYEQIGIRSHGKGIFYKDPVTGESLGNKRVFWIQANVLIINIVFAWEQAIARTTNKENGMIASHRFPMYRPKKGLLNLDFILSFFLIKKGKRLLELASPGGAGRNKTLGQKAFEKLKVILPEVSEQQKIATFLTAVDRRIQLLQEKATHLQAYKKGMMQQLFSRQLRFKDENGEDFGEWEEKRFREIYDFKSTNSFSRDKLNYKNGTIYNIHYGDIHTKFSSGFNIENELVPFINLSIDKSKIKEESYLREGDLVIADASEDYNDVGKTIEVINVANKKVVAGLHTFLARQRNNDFVLGFSRHLMKSRNIRLKIMKIAQGTKVLGISMRRLDDILIPIPHKQEQQKIANFLSKIDKRLALVDDKIETLQTWKKGLLQKMLV